MKNTEKSVRTIKEQIHILFLAETGMSDVEEIFAYLELQTEFQIVRVSNVEQVKEKIMLCLPDVVLLYMALAPSFYSGLDIIFELIQIYRLRIVVVTSPNECEYVIDAFILGVLNVVYKENYKDIVTIVQEICQGRISIHADTASILRQEIVRLRLNELNKLLTPTEKKVLEFLFLDCTKRQIAEKLEMDISAVKFHVRKLIQKLGGRTGREAALNASRKGYHFIMKQDTK